MMWASLQEPRTCDMWFLGAPLLRGTGVFRWENPNTVSLGNPELECGRWAHISLYLFYMSNVSKPKVKKIISRDIAIKQLKRAHEGVKVENPFGPFHDLFEEDREADKFLCDPMFWRHFESIDTKRAMQTNSIEFRSLKIMFYESIFYVIFMLLFTAYAYSMQSPELMAVRTMQRNYWGGCSTESACRLHLVKDQATFWRWFEHDFVPLAYTPAARYDLPVARLETAFNGNGLSIFWSPRFVIDETNILLGSIRVRQVRVKGNTDGGMGCKPSAMYRHIFTQCFPPFTQYSEDRNAYYQTFTPTYTRGYFKWQSETETLAVPYKGNATTYSASGYFFDMPLHRREARVLLRDLHQWKWMDQQTRAVIIEFNSLNSNVNILTNNRIVFEFSPSGRLRPLHSIQVWPLAILTFATSGDSLMIFVGMVVVVVMLLLSSLYVLWQIVRIRFKYFSYAWNWLDIVIIALLYIYMAVRLVIFSNVSAEPSLAADKIGHPEEFHAFSKAALDSATVAPKILSVTILLVWIKFNKYLALCGYFRPFLRVFQRCAKELAVLSLLVVVLFFGFSVAFFIGFGDEQEIFTTMDSATLVLYFFLLGGFRVNYQDWFAPGGADSTRPLLFLLFFLLVYFVCFNVFMAIVLDAYTMVQIFNDESKYLPHDRKNPMSVFVVAYYHALKGITLVSDGQMDEPELQTIKLCLLPGLVAKKWVEKRKRLHTLLNQDTENEGNDDQLSTLARWRSATSRKLLPYTAQAAMKMGHLPKEKKGSNNIYALEAKLGSDFEISATQLQRLLNDDRTLRLLLGTDNASNVIQRFKFQPPHGDMEVDILQNTVFRRLDQLEKSGLEMEARRVPQVRDLSNTLDNLYADIQNQWRMEVTGVLELTSMLSEGLINLTRNLESVADNHETVLKTLEASSGDNSNSDSSSEGSSSSSGSSY